MMTRKTISTWAIIMIIVFGGTVILYPMLFNPEHNADEKGSVSDQPMMPTPPPPAIPPIK